MQDRSEITEKDPINSTIVADLLKEKRKDRFWRNFRSFAWLLLIAYIVFSLFSLREGGQSISGKSQNYVALVRIDGTIAPGRGFSGDELLPVLRDAFADKNAEGVIIDINSPGGTPVQASIIHDAILHLKKKYNKKVIVVGEDLLTSGAYYVAVAADKIYVNPNTLTGSIGVIMKGFGFVKLMEKIGVERRVYTSGDQKDRLDPFLPQTASDIQKIKDVTQEIHTNFVNVVMEGRKNKLHGDPQVLFSGDFWTGQTALKLGLVDNLGNLMDAMNTEFKTTRYKEYGQSSGLLKLLTGQISSSVDEYLYGMR